MDEHRHRWTADKPKTCLLCGITRAQRRAERRARQNGRDHIIDQEAEMDDARAVMDLPLAACCAANNHSGLEKTAEWGER